MFFNNQSLLQPMPSQRTFNVIVVYVQGFLNALILPRLSIPSSYQAMQSPLSLPLPRCCLPLRNPPRCLFLIQYLTMTHSQLQLEDPDGCALQNQALLGMFLFDTNALFTLPLYVGTSVLLIGARKTRAHQMTLTSIGVV